MRRKAFCVVADIEPRRFDTLLMRGQVPFTKKEDGWGEYSLDDAFRLRLMLDFIDDHGCEIAAAHAAIMIGLTTHWLTVYPLAREKPKHDTWLAIASVSFKQEDEYQAMPTYLAAPYHAIPQLVQGIGENHAAETGRLEKVEVFDGVNGPDLRTVATDPEYSPGRIIMVNASLAARKVVLAAEALDIELSDEDFPTFDENAPEALCDLSEAADGWQSYAKRKGLV